MNKSLPGTPGSTRSFTGYIGTPNTGRGTVDVAQIDRVLNREAAQRERSGWAQFKTRATYYIPLLHWLPRYRLRYLPGDVVASLTLASFLVPQGLSYATALAHLPPLSGIFASIIPSFVYGVLGTCREPAMGPEASLSLILGECITKIIEVEEHAHGPLPPAERTALALTIATIVTFEAGAISFGLGLLRLGFLDAVLSKALLRGFITALACVISLGQVFIVLGLQPGHADSTLEKIRFLASHVGEAHLPTLTIALSALFTLVVVRSLKRRFAHVIPGLTYFPEIFAVVVLTTALSHFKDWESHGVAVLGRVSLADARLGLPLRTLAESGRATSLLGTSTVIAVLGFLDTIVGSKDSASRNDYAISPNRELVAVGAANLGAAFVYGTLPGYGSITRSRLASATGARTQLVAILTGSFVLLTTLFLLPYCKALPTCILSVIICLVVYTLFREAPHDIHFFWHLRAYPELALMTLTFVLTLFGGVELGIAVSIAISMCLCIKRSSQVTIKILGRVPGTNKYDPVDDPGDEDTDYIRFMSEHGSGDSSVLLESGQGSGNSSSVDRSASEPLFSLNEETPGVLVVRIRDTSLNFANAGALKERLRRLERYGRGRHHPSERPRRDEARVVVFHLADIESVDASALQIVYETTQSYRSRGVHIYWTHLSPSVRLRLAKAGILELCGGVSHVQPNVYTALHAAETAQSIDEEFV